MPAMPAMPAIPVIPDSASEFQFCRVQPSGLNVGYVSRGSGPLVIFLHGFPDTHHGFLPAMERAASEGYRAVAPEPRGYAPTELPADGDYRVETLARDVLGLADALGAERFSLVGHDIGALTAYAVANLAPQRVERLITGSVPHTGHFLLNIRLRQAIRSRYMVYFQLPHWPQQRVRRNDFAYLEQLIRAWSPGWTPTQAMLSPMKDNYRQAGRTEAALGVYRQLAHSIASPLSRRLIFSPVTVPTRMLYGTQDQCIGTALFQGQQKQFTQPLELVPIDAGHFLQWEQPDAFAEQVIGFLPRG